MAAARTSSRAGSREDQRNNMVQLNVHRQQLQREIDRIAGLLNTREVHAESILRSTFNDNGGAPSNTPAHSPKGLSGYTDSNYVTTPGIAEINNSNVIQSLQMQRLEFETNDTKDSNHSESFKKFMSINDLLTSENDSTFPGSSPLGNKTLEFINQTTMTGNHTMFLNTAQSNQSVYDSTKRVSSGSGVNTGAETSTFFPMSVLDASKPVNLQSSPNKNQYSVNAPYETKNKRQNLFNNVNGQSSNDEKQNWGNAFGLPDPKNELALSSSPIPTFETRFPEPRPIHELFDAVPIDSNLIEGDDDDDDGGDETVSEESSDDSDDEVATYQVQDIIHPAVSFPLNQPIKHQTVHKAKQASRPKLTSKAKKAHIESNIGSDAIDCQLKLEDQLQRLSNSTQEESEDLPKFDLSPNIKNALRKRKKVSYNLDNISEYTEIPLADSPKTSRLKRRAKRQRIQPKKSQLASSSPIKYKRASSSGSNRSYRRKKMIQSRSKSGCWTCRIRKKKCTEERPSCEQCIKLGLTCDGYSDDRPYFMMNQQSQRQRLDEIKHHTSQRKKIGVKKVKVDQ